MKRIFENQKLLEEFQKYLEDTLIQFKGDVEYFKNNGDKSYPFISVNPNQYGEPHIWCNYVPKHDPTDIFRYGSHGYDIEKEEILENFLEFKNKIREQKLKRILNEQN